MSNRIEAPGHTALWTKAALRALTGTAFLIHEDGMIQANGGSLGATAAREIALDAMAIATAFEAACIAAHEAEQEARRERVRTIGRFSYGVATRIFRVGRVAGAIAHMVPEDGEGASRHALISELFSEEDGWTPAPLDASAPPTTGGEERA